MIINKIRNIAIFAAVVKQGTFRSAASQLGLSPTRVSEAVAELEKELGVTLLYRSTRSQSLTPEGASLYEHAKAMIKSAERGVDAAMPSNDEASGHLRVTLPSFAATTNLMGRFEAFATAFPKIEVSYNYTDEKVDLIEDGFDVAIRAGWVKDGVLKSREIGRAERLLVVGAEYAATKPEPKHPSDLEDWNWVRYTVRKPYAEVTSSAGEVVQVFGKTGVTVDAADAVHQHALSGFGITPLPEQLARAGMESGQLVQLLPDWSLDPIVYRIIWPAQVVKKNLTLKYVNFLSDFEGDVPPGVFKVA